MAKSVRIISSAYDYIKNARLFNDLRFVEYKDEIVVYPTMSKLSCKKKDDKSIIRTILCQIANQKDGTSLELKEKEIEESEFEKAGNNSLSKEEIEEFYDGCLQEILETNRVQAYSSFETKYAYSIGFTNGGIIERYIAGLPV